VKQLQSRIFALFFLTAGVIVMPNIVIYWLVDDLGVGRVSGKTLSSLSYIVFAFTLTIWMIRRGSNSFLFFVVAFAAIILCVVALLLGRGDWVFVTSWAALCIVTLFWGGRAVPA